MTNLGVTLPNIKAAFLSEDLSIQKQLAEKIHKFFRCLSPFPGKPYSSPLAHLARLDALRRGSFQIELLEELPLPVEKVEGNLLLSLSPDGKKVVITAYEDFFLSRHLFYDLEAKKFLAEIKNEFHHFSLHLTNTFGIEDNTSLPVYEIATGKLLRQLNPGPTSSVTCLAVSQDETLAIAGFKNGSIRVWKLQDGTLLHDLSHGDKTIRDIKITPDGKTAVSVSASTGMVWDLELGTPRHILPVVLEDSPVHKLLRVALTPDGEKAILVSSGTMKCEQGDDDSDFVYTLQGTPITLSVWNLQTGTCLQNAPGSEVCSMCSDDTSDLHLTSDGKKMISVTGRTLKIWNIDDGRLLLDLNEIQTRSPKYKISYETPTFAITPDSKKLILPTHRTLYEATPRFEVAIWEIESGKNISTIEPLLLPPRKETYPILAYPLVMSLDGSKLIVGMDFSYAASPSKLLVFDIVTGKCVFEKELPYPPKSIQLCPDGITLCVTTACPVEKKTMLYHYLIQELK